MINVLLVDTNFSSGPIYHFLIQSGHNVTVVGVNPNDALAKSVDDYVQLDYSDVEKTKQLIADRQIDYLVPGCNDRSYMVCAELNQDGRFPGIDPLETAEIINNKEKFRAFATQHNLPTPRVLAEREIGSRWPVIVKPVDAFSGRGVTIIHKENSHELPIALDLARQASRTKTCIVEDYVEGQLYSHTAFIQSGEIITDHIVQEYGSANPFVVDTSRVIYDFPAAILDDIRGDITLLAAKLSLQDGLVHTQFIKNGSQYWLIEITRRCPGDLYSQLIELSTGLNYAENYARPFMRLRLNITGNNQKKRVMRHTLTQSCEYNLGSLSFNLPLKIVKWVPIAKTGDALQASPYDRMAVLFAEEESEQTLIRLFNLACRRQLYTVFK
jgi:carbamoylphosphate synthase large subunit